MQHRKSVVPLLLLAIALAWTASACSGGKANDGNTPPSVSGNGQQNGGGQSHAGNGDKGDDDKNAASQEPVEIIVAHPWDENVFKQRYSFIDERLPNVTMSFVNFDGTSPGLQEHFAAGVYPDIIVTGLYGTYYDLDLIYPIEDLVKKHNFDLSYIAPSLISDIRSRDPEGRLIAFPDGTAYGALYYNKEVFDLFGVPYPDPNVAMTWEEVVDLARQLTGERNGKTYLGLEVTTQPLSEIAQNLTDPETGDVLLDDLPEFTKYFELMKQLYSIPGMKQAMFNEEGNFNFQFTQGLSAMTLSINNFLGWDWGEFNAIKENIDLAPMPVWKDHPGVVPPLLSTPQVISSYSKHPDEAFEVLREYVSRENQIRVARSMASAPVTTDPEVLKQFGADIPEYAGKNVQAYFVGKPAEFDGRKSMWDDYVDMGEALRRFAQSDMDVPRFLREFSEEAQARVADAMAAN